jgi:glutaminase
MARTKRAERTALRNAVEEIEQEMRETDGWGMPAEDAALSRVDLHQFGLAVAIPGEGIVSAAGDSDKLFSIQSISKVLSLELAHWRRSATRSGNASAASPRATLSTR